MHGNRIGRIMTMRYSACALATVALVVVLAAPLPAHHSFAAQYDREQPVTLTGAVTRIEWNNPHVYFYIDVLNEETGEVENWAWEMGAPAVIQRQGWRRNSMDIGALVTVDGWRARTGENHANARTVILASTGQELGAGTSADVTP
jgi:hypothetical protein